MSLELERSPCSAPCCRLDSTHDHGDCVHFATPTDALFAELHLVHNIPARYIDTFLQLLKTPRFDANALSFGRTVDIDAGVAAFRAHRAAGRLSDGTGQGWVGTRFCYDLVPLLIEKIVEDRVPLAAVPDGPTFSGADTLAAQTPSHVAERLKALALTHRAFTLPAQRALGERLVVGRAEHLRALAQSPLVGPWTQALLVQSAFSSAHESQYASAEEALAALSGVLRRALGLQYLKVRTPGSVHDTNALDALLDAAGRLRELETLVWLAPLHSGRHGRIDVERIRTVVKKMPSLRTLVLQNVRAGWVDQEDDEDEDIDAPATCYTSNINKLVLTGIDCPVGPLPSIARLLDPTCGVIEDLSLDLSANTHSLAAAFSASNALTKLHTLRLAFGRMPTMDILRTLFAQPNVHTTTFPDLRPNPLALEAAPPLQTLDIRIAPSPHTYHILLLFPIRFPVGVRTLRLALLQLQPLLQTASSSSPSASLTPMQPSASGSWRPAAAALRGRETLQQWHAQETQIEDLLKHWASALPVLENLELVTPFQPTRRRTMESDDGGDGSCSDLYPWSGLRAACKAREIKLTLSTELTC